MKTREQDFASLVQAVQGGDQEAFRDLMPILQPVVESVVTRISSARYGVQLSREDLTQEAWIAIYQALCSYDTVQYPTPLHTFFRNAIMSRFTSAVDRSYGVAMRRPLKRFLYDVRGGAVDWSLADEALTQYYPSVSVTDIAYARYYGSGAWDVISGGDLDYFDRGAVRRLAATSVEESVCMRLDATLIIKSFVEQLSELERKVFVLRFVQKHPRAAVSRELKYSLVKIQKIESGILAKRGGCSVDYAPELTDRASAARTAC